MRLSKDIKHPPTKKSIEEMRAALLEMWDGRFLEIIEDNNSALGFCLLVDHIEKEKIAEIEKKIESCTGLKIKAFGKDEVAAKHKHKDHLSIINKTAHVTSRERDSFHPGIDHFEKDLASLYDQAKRTRLPFALILMQPNFTDQLEKIDRPKVLNSFNFLIKIVNEKLDSRDRFYQIGDPGTGLNDRQKGQKFAVIMNTAGINRAREKAEGFRRFVKSETSSNKNCLSATLSIGVGIYVMGSNFTPSDFTQSVEDNLKNAVACGGDYVQWEQRKAQENSCQVTAEERTQLFKCFN